MNSTTTIPPALSIDDVADLRRRIGELEFQVSSLNQAVKARAPGVRRWWRDQLGAFANDPVYEEINRLGREWREAQRPSEEGAGT